MDRAKTQFEVVPLEIVQERIARGEIVETATDDGAFPLGAGGSSAAALRYPQWQGPFHAALVELNSDKLKELVAIAETAVNYRLQSISDMEHERAERLALEDALAGLRVLKREGGKNESSA